MPDGGTAVLPPVPAEARPIADVIGAEGLLRLIEARGGTSLQLGKRAAPVKRMAKSLGLEPAAVMQLRAAFGNQRIKVPLLRPWRARIYRAQGLSYAEIALKLGVTDSAVHVYLRDAGLTNQLCMVL